MKKKWNTTCRTCGPNAPWPALDHTVAPYPMDMTAPVRPMDHMNRSPMGPVMPGHMNLPLQSGIPYPWMTRPSIDPGMASMGMWSQNRWTPQMWDPTLDNDQEEMREREYWQQMYPAQTRRVQQEVEHQCDLLDYEGSVMYDEYPDRLSLSRVCEAVYQTLMQSGALDNQGMMSGEMTGNMTQNSTSEFEEDMNMGDLTPEEETAGAANYLPIDQIDMMQQGHRSISNRNARNGRSDRSDRSLQNLIEVLLYQEMMRRRRQRRRRGRSWYLG